MEQSKRKKITVITTTFNILKAGRRKRFIKMFESVHNQTYPEIEHLFIDGASSDGTQEFIEELCRNKGRKEWRIISEPDEGITDATIKGVEKASGEYVIIMCSDDWYTRNDALELLANALEKENADYVSAEGLWHLKKVWKNSHASFVFRHPFLINTMLAKKSVFDKYGHFDKNLKLLADYDLMFRLIKNEKLKGAEIHECITVLAPGGISSMSDKLYNEEVTQIYKKNFSAKCQITDNDCLNIHYGCPDKNLRARILGNEKNGKIKESFIFFISALDYYKISATHFKMLSKDLVKPSIIIYKRIERTFLFFLCFKWLTHIVRDIFGYRSTLKIIHTDFDNLHFKEQK